MILIVDVLSCYTYNSIDLIAHYAVCLIPEVDSGL